MREGKVPARPKPKGSTPTLREERRLLRSGHRLVAAIDEVGRGALAGPVTVGVVVVDENTPSAPAGVRETLDMWGPVHGLALMRRVKDQFDADHRLSPGRFVGEI